MLPVFHLIAPEESPYGWLYDVPPDINMNGARVAGLLPDAIVAIVTFPALIAAVVISFAYSAATSPNVENDASEMLKPLPAVSICDAVDVVVWDTDFQAARIIPPNDRCASLMSAELPMR